MKYLDLAAMAHRKPGSSRRQRRGAAKAPSRQFYPGYLCDLEERVVLSPLTFTVTTTADAGVGSLRAQIINANNNPGDDTIVFSLPANSVINLTSGALPINPTTFDDSLIIDAGNNPVTINALNNTANSNPPVNQGIFQITGTGDVKLGSLIMQNALLPQAAANSQAAVSRGGAVNDTGSGTLWLSKDTFLGNRADLGGAVYYNPALPTSTGSLVIDQSQFGRLVGGSPDASAANQASFQGGAVYYVNPNGATGGLQVSGSQFYGNTANNLAPGTTLSEADGGAIFDFDNGSPRGLSVLSSTFNGNRAIGQNGGNGVGGGVYYFGLSATTTGVTLDGTTFTNNVAQGGGTGNGGTGFGGGAFLTSAATNVSNSTFNGNQANGGGATGANFGGFGEGGALYTTGTTLSISDGTTFGFTGPGNQANGGAGGGAGLGGAIYTDVADAKIFGFFYSNAAKGGDNALATANPLNGQGQAQGGAIFNNRNLSLTLAGFFGNSATGGTGNSAATGVAGGAAFGGSVFNGPASTMSASGSTVLFSVTVGGAGGAGSAGAGGAGGDANGAIFGGSPTIINTIFLNNLSLGGNGGNGTTGTPARGGSAFGAAITSFDVADNINVTNSTFTNDVSQGGVGSAGGRGGDAEGGAIYSSATTFSLTGVAGTTTFSGNQANGGAGGSVSTINGVAGAGGSAFGGALFDRAATSQIARATFNSTTNGSATGGPTLGNGATGGAGGTSTNASSISGTGGLGGDADGGSIYLGFVGLGSLDLSTSTFSNGFATGGKGGGIGGNTGNLGAGGNANGGAIAVATTNDTLVVNTGTFTGNKATGGGAGASTANPVLLGTAGVGQGGAIYNNGITTVNTSTLSGNSALGGSNGYGGGAFNDSGAPSFVISFSTVTGNTATSSGADLYNNGGNAKRHFTTVGSAVGWPGSF